MSTGGAVPLRECSLRGPQTTGPGWSIAEHEVAKAIWLASPFCAALFFRIERHDFSPYRIAEEDSGRALVCCLSPQIVT